MCFLFKSEVYNIYTMLFTSIVRDYFRWHYTAAFREIFHLWLNFLWFTIHFFSLPQLARSWLAPWKRMTESRGSNWSFEDLASFIIINLISRLIGALLRTIIIAIGFSVLMLVVVTGFVTYLFWIIAPVVIFALLASGITLLLTNSII